MSTTRWSDAEAKSLDQAISLLMDSVEDDNDIYICWKNWRLEKAFSTNQSVVINGNNIIYNVIKYSYDQVTIVPSPSEDRTIQKSGRIIVYSSGISVNYIIDQNSNALKMLRRLLSYSGKNEIQKNCFEFESDFFIWMIFRVFTKSITIENNKDDKSTILQLDAIKGFKGNTEDLQTKVSADGEAVMNLISTLSFLLESSALNQIKIDIHYTDHDHISLILQQSTINIDIKSYQGNYENHTEDQKIAELYLLVYLELLPLLEQEYISDKVEKQWGKEQCTEFLNNVATLLNDRIQEKILRLNIEPCKCQ